MIGAGGAQRIDMANMMPLGPREDIGELPNLVPTKLGVGEVIPFDPGVWT